MEPFEFHRAHLLTVCHKTRRLKICKWFFFEKKLMTFTPQPDHHKSKCWSMESPHLYEDWHQQGEEKIMCTVGIADKLTPAVHSFEETGRVVSITKDHYFNLLENIRFFVTYRAQVEGFWFSKITANHCTKSVLNFINIELVNRVTSQKSELEWSVLTGHLAQIWNHFIICSGCKSTEQLIRRRLPHSKKLRLC